MPTLQILALQLARSGVLQVVLPDIRDGASSACPILLAPRRRRIATSFCQFCKLVKREAIFRIVIDVKDRPQKSAPNSPMSGKSLAVFGSCLGAGSAAAVSTAGAGAVGTGTVTIRIGTSAFGCGGGGGIFPVLFISSAITVSGTSVTLCAWTFIPFLRLQASFSSPSTTNFCPLGILKLWLVPFSNVKITVLGGVTCHTVPLTVSTVVIILGVELVMVCFSTFMPTLALWMLTGFPSTRTVTLSGMLSKCLRVPSSIFMTALFPLR